jgi:protein-S-isoprenylcysteine O-methyltransferase Ste14
VDNGLGKGLLVAGYLTGWTIAVIATFLINHFELFGLQQVWLHSKDRPMPPAHYTERFLYRFVRHPLQMGILIGMWSLPTMTATQFFLSATMTVYIFIGLYFEEKDLEAELGEPYRNYKQRVRKIIPVPR